MLRIGLGVVLGALALACAPPTMYGRGFSYQFGSEVKEDSPGHWTGAYENHGVCLDNVGEKDEEGGVLTGTGTFDGVWTSKTQMTTCKSSGKNVCAFRDGTHIDEYTATCKLGPDGRLSSEGSGSFVSGTGRFEGIQGTVSFTSWNLSGPPENIGYSKVVGKFTLPKK